MTLDAAFFAVILFSSFVCSELLIATLFVMLGRVPCQSDGACKPGGWVEFGPTQPPPD